MESGADALCPFKSEVCRRSDGPAARLRYAAHFFPRLFGVKWYSYNKGFASSRPG